MSGSKKAFRGWVVLSCALLACGSAAARLSSHGGTRTRDRQAMLADATRDQIGREQKHGLAQLFRRIRFDFEAAAVFQNQDPGFQADPDRRRDLGEVRTDYRKRAALDLEQIADPNLNLPFFVAQEHSIPQWVHQVHDVGFVAEPERDIEKHDSNVLVFGFHGPSVAWSTFVSSPENALIRHSSSTSSPGENVLLNLGDRFHFDHAVVRIDGHIGNRNAGVRRSPARELGADHYLFLPLAVCHESQKPGGHLLDRHISMGRQSHQRVSLQLAPAFPLAWDRTKYVDPSSIRPDSIIPSEWLDRQADQTRCVNGAASALPALQNLGSSLGLLILAVQHQLRNPSPGNASSEAGRQAHGGSSQTYHSPFSTDEEIL